MGGITKSKYLDQIMLFPVMDRINFQLVCLPCAVVQQPHRGWYSALIKSSLYGTPPPPRTLVMLSMTKRWLGQAACHINLGNLQEDWRTEKYHCCKLITSLPVPSVTEMIIASWPLVWITRRYSLDTNPLWGTLPKPLRLTCETALYPYVAS